MLGISASDPLLFTTMFCVRCRRRKEFNYFITNSFISKGMMDEDHKCWKNMTKLMMKINKKETGMFNTIHIKDHSYGEVSRSFVVRWKNDLDDTWHLLYKDDNVHSIKYNKNLQNPTIMAGWTQLREFYGLTDNHQLTITYYGSSVFPLTVLKSNSQPQAFPK
ncbi:hypothetical protein HKD37_19G052614 [Glycine soja]